MFRVRNLVNTTTTLQPPPSASGGCRHLARHHHALAAEQLRDLLVEDRVGVGIEDRVGGRRAAPADAAPQPADGVALSAAARLRPRLVGVALGRLEGARLGRFGHRALGWLAAGHDAPVISVEYFHSVDAVSTLST